jgi:hypothetical protein
MLDESWLNQAFCQYNHHRHHGGNLLASDLRAAISLMPKGVRTDHFSPGLPRGTSIKFPITLTCPYPFRHKTSLSYYYSDHSCVYRVFYPWDKREKRHMRACEIDKAGK